jgi:hypothetical protein
MEEFLIRRVGSMRRAIPVSSVLGAIDQTITFLTGIQWLTDHADGASA